MTLYTHTVIMKRIKPKKRVKLKGALFRVWLMDEIPGIPSGLRKVDVVIGRKWVSVRLPGAPRAHKVSLAQWNELGAEAV